ncbi:MAG TPA: methyltransferase [Chloroflexia bacterium]|nr:methyltransferase [Chloroflexia bacterium]
MSDDAPGAPGPLQARDFDQGVVRYEDYLRSPLGWLRDALIWQHVESRLGGAGLRILDAGCGPGTLALRLAEAGHTVLGVDVAAAMIARARESADAAPAAVQSRLTFAVADLHELEPDPGAPPYDVVLCHNVLEFSPDPPALVQRLAELLADRGALSLVVANQASPPLKAAVAGHDLAGALRALRMAGPTASVFGMGKRAFAVDALLALCAAAGLAAVDVRPIRVVADLLPPELLTDEKQREPLLALEVALGERPEYRAVGRMIWAWARRR